MKLLTDDLRQRLLANGAGDREMDHVPLVKFFDPCGMATWIISEMMPAEEEAGEPDILFGLCDLGLGTPELGYVSLTELEGIKGRLGLGIERDLYFQARLPLSVYARAAQDRGRIVETESALIEVARVLGVAVTHPTRQSLPGNKAVKD
jgi:hypothetical protein